MLLPPPCTSRYKLKAVIPHSLRGPQPAGWRCRNECGMTTSSGFSLVELSIVLVILGLLVGGVLTGQSLIRAAELRSVTTELQKFQAATNTFRDKYFALPGDMTNAQSFWGVAHATAATCVTTASSSALTCNGNGDGIILPSTGSNESYRFWQHLANAGLIEGQYDGISHGSAVIFATASTADNSPKSKISNAYWFVFNWPSLSAVGGLFDGIYNNYLLVGALVADSYPAASVFKPEELWNIDTKVDDGKPAVGKLVVGANGGLSTCTTATGTAAAQAATLTADYLLTSTSKTCAAIFRQIF